MPHAAAHLLLGRPAFCTGLRQQGVKLQHHALAMLVEHCLRDGVACWKYWYSEPTDTPATSAMRLVVSPCSPCAGNDLRDRLEDGLDSELGTLLPGAAAWEDAVEGMQGPEQRRVGSARAADYAGFNEQENTCRNVSLWALGPVLPV